MPLTSSDEDDARFEEANRRFGPLCPDCYSRLSQDGYCDECDCVAVKRCPNCNEVLTMTDGDPFEDCYYCGWEFESE